MHATIAAPVREIVLDTETTGLDPEADHRIVEVACWELLNHIPSGRFFHAYVNPERDVPEQAFQVHGLSFDFLKDFPTFPAIAQGFLEFVQGGTLVIHNAGFDLKFLNYQLRQCGLGNLDHLDVVDTLKLARKKFPGSPVSLDALCKRFKVDLSRREKHGALLDVDLLSQVYLELLGGRQVGMRFEEGVLSGAEEGDSVAPKALRPSRGFAPSEEDKILHQKLLDDIRDPLWRKRG